MNGCFEAELTSIIEVSQKVLKMIQQFHYLVKVQRK